MYWPVIISGEGAGPVFSTCPVWRGSSPCVCNPSFIIRSYSMDPVC